MTNTPTLREMLQQAKTQLELFTYDEMDRLQVKRPITLEQEIAELLRLAKRH